MANQRLSDWASAAEIIGSVAIVVTLIVLIFEMRGNTDEMRAATLANLAARTQAFPLAVATNPQVANLWARIEAGEELSPSDEAQIKGVVVIALKLEEKSFIARRDGRLDEEVWRTRAAFALLVLRHQSLRDYWKQMRLNGAFIPAFEKRVVRI